MWFLNKSFIKKESLNIRDLRPQRGRGKTKECLVFLFTQISLCVSHRKLGVKLLQTFPRNEAVKLVSSVKEYNCHS